MSGKRFLSRLLLRIFWFHAERGLDSAHYFFEEGSGRIYVHFFYTTYSTGLPLPCAYVFVIPLVLIFVATSFSFARFLWDVRITLRNWTAIICCRRYLYLYVDTVGVCPGDVHVLTGLCSYFVSYCSTFLCYVRHCLYAFPTPQFWHGPTDCWFTVQ